MRIKFACVERMGSIIEELRDRDIEFECWVNDLGDGIVYVEKRDKNAGLLSKVAA